MSENYPVKKSAVKSKKIGMSMPPDLYRRAKDRSAALGYASFSEYTQFLLELDCQSEPEHIVKQTFEARVYSDEEETDGEDRERGLNS